MKHLREFVTSVPEYRRTGKGNFKHKLEDILMLVILGRLSKCITKTEILEFGKRYPIWIINRIVSPCPNPFDGEGDESLRP